MADVGTVLSGVGSVLGALPSMFSSGYDSEQAMRDQNAFSLRATRRARQFNYQQWKRELIQAQNQWRKNAALQKQFAQMGIRWKVQDAMAAGLHPLYALGGAGSTFSPSIAVPGIGGTPVAQGGQFAGSQGTSGLSGLSEALGGMGQALSGATRSTMSPEEKKLMDLQIKEIEWRNRESSARVLNTGADTRLKNESARTERIQQALLAAQKAVIFSREMAGGVGMPSGSGGISKAGVPAVDAVSVIPAQQVSRAGSDAGRIAGGIRPSYQMVQLPGGLRVALPTEELAEQLEGNPMAVPVGSYIGAVGTGKYYAGRMGYRYPKWSHPGQKDWTNQQRAYYNRFKLY